LSYNLNLATIARVLSLQAVVDIPPKAFKPRHTKALNAFLYSSNTASIKIFEKNNKKVIFMLIIVNLCDKIYSSANSTSYVLTRGPTTKHDFLLQLVEDDSVKSAQRQCLSEV